MRNELNANAALRKQLKAKLAATEEPPPLLHPEMARIYCAKLTEFASALQDLDSRSEATKALRGLVDAVLLTPNEAGETLQIALWTGRLFMSLWPDDLATVAGARKDFV